ncbi:L-type lectin-domain containing receptor [Vigna angularis]|uniref:L-type lectin-domain containing receptor n=1 Tax=Phaseolus angularis TaxID=3914 RepID=A0A8T0JU59_PHAAN|nr:L-type lectin-domain containing receptor [Vigna angularis]
MCLLWYASTHHPDPHLPAKHVSDAGLSPSQLQKLPSITGKDLLMGSECAVCLDDIATDQPARLVPGCNHAFHVECAVGDSTAVWVSYSTVRPKDPILKVDLDVGMYLNDFMYVGFSWNGTVGAVAGVVTVGAFHPALFAGAFIWVYSKKGFSANRVIGHGAFGTLYKGVLPESGDTVAVKRCNHSGQGSSSSKEASFPSLFLVRSRMEGKRFGGTVIMAKRLRGAREFHDKASSRHHYSCRFGDFDTVGGGLGLLLIRLGVRDLNGVLTGFGVYAHPIGG